MAENNTHHSRNSQSIERKMERGEDGFMDGDQMNKQKVGTHTPGTHQRSETVREGQKDGDTKQMHENRENPAKDHVPGHMGYTRENLVGVNPETDESDATLGSTKRQSH
jgi:hypothetical protein